MPADDDNEERERAYRWFQERDPRAYEYLERRLMEFASRQGLSPEIAREAVHRVLCSIYRIATRGSKWPWHDAKHWVSYACRSVRSKVVDEWRERNENRERPHSPSDLTGLVEASDQSPETAEDVLQSRETGPRIKAALERAMHHIGTTEGRRSAFHRALHCVEAGELRSVLTAGGILRAGQSPERDRLALQAERKTWHRAISDMRAGVQQLETMGELDDDDVSLVSRFLERLEAFLRKLVLSPRA